MNKISWRFVVVASICLVSGAALFVDWFVVNASPAPETIMPERALARALYETQAKNPDGVADSAFKLSFDDACSVGVESRFHGVAQYSGMVLVKLDSNTLTNTAFGIPCPEGTLFWRGEQQFRMDAQFYRQALARQSKKLSEQDLVRRLLDEQFARR